MFVVLTVIALVPTVSFAEFKIDDGPIYSRGKPSRLSSARAAARQSQADAVVIPAPTLQMTDDGSVIDVLVLYTADSMEVLKKIVIDDNSTRSDIDYEIKATFEAANKILTDSGIGFQFRL
ncbi:MAG: hypothetical protein AAB425_04000, partial [Bdellovibrionota bacterium]